MRMPILKFNRELLVRSKVTEQRLEDALRLIAQNFGESWIEQGMINEKGSPAKIKHLVDQHIIPRSFAGGLTDGTLSLVELSTYLESFSEDPSLQRIIQAMKPSNSTFWDHFYELAIAYRFKSISTNTVLEPGASTGDFYSTFIGNEMIGECTVVRPETVYSKISNLFDSLAEVYAKRHKIDRASFLITVKKLEIVNEYRELKNLIMKLDKDFSGEFFDIKVYQRDEAKKYLGTGDQVRNLGDIGVSVGTVPGNKEDLSSLQLHREDRTGFFFFNLESIKDEYAYDIVDKINSKISSKMAQIKKHPKDKLLYLFVEVQKGIENMDFNRVSKRIANNFFNNNDWLNGIYLTQRVWDGVRHSYVGGFFNNPNLPDQIPLDLRKKLIELEESNNFYYPLKISGIGRNDPCHCGKKKKYKKCCGRYS